MRGGAPFRISVTRPRARRACAFELRLHDVAAQDDGTIAEMLNFCAWNGPHVRFGEDCCRCCVNARCASKAAAAEAENTE